MCRVMFHFRFVIHRGYFCVNGVRSPCPPGRYGNVRGLSSEECSGLCPPGHYCLSASVNPKTNRCPRGRYGMFLLIVRFKST